MQISLTRLFGVALIAIVCMAFVPVLIKSTSANEVTIGIARLAIAVLAFFPLVFWKQGFQSLKAADWLLLIVIGVVFGAHWLGYFYSIKLSTASLGAIAMSTYGIHLLILNWLFKKSRFRLLEWLSIVICFGGCLLAVPELNLENSATLGMVIGVFSGLLYAALPLLHQRAPHIPTITRAWGQFAFALLVFLPLWDNSNWQLTSTDWWRLIILGTLCTVIAHGLWVKVSTELPPVLTSMAYYLYIPLAMIFSWYYLNEEITAQKAIGAALIICANLSQPLATLWRKHRRRL